MKYERDGEKLRCPKHKTRFVPGLEQCPGCAADPITPQAEDLAPPCPPPDGCRNSDDHERWLTELADDCREQADKLCTGKGRINYATAAKLLECAIKAARAAAEFTRSRERREYVKTLRKEALRLRRRGAGR